MNRFQQTLLCAMMGLSLVACNLGNLLSTNEKPVTIPTRVMIASKTPKKIQPSPSAAPTQIATPTVVAGVGETPIASTAQVGLAAPSLIEPFDGAKFNNNPRTLTLQWSAVPGASKYVLEILACETTKPPTCFPHPMYEKTSRETNETTYAFTFAGSQPGKWRVWAVDNNGVEGTKSQWWNFTFRK